MYVVFLSLCDTNDQFGMFLHIKDYMSPRIVNFLALACLNSACFTRKLCIIVYTAFENMKIVVLVSYAKGFAM
jgi:hypothetical protein